MWARLAQRLEHRICNAMVIGSTPIAGFFPIILFYFSMIDDILKKYGKDCSIFAFFKC